ncbi:hypothetical protein VP01_3953g1 [Puccinia sorghi]|uniref:Uncharacterized protein n=1 Tax=Puccinia sorghi TaxID=27349 RepID=A0A0L6UUB5_9BASI|nr:hypothetical protein VP01_3953g1 [Puccinia sorghi]
MTLPNNKNLIANQTFVYILLTWFSFSAWLSATLMVKFMILLQGESWKKIKTWFGWPILSSSSSEDSHSHCYSPPRLSSNIPSLFSLMSLVICLSLIGPGNPSSHSWNLVNKMYGCFFGEKADSQPSAKHSVHHHNMLHIIKLISPLGCSSNHCDCIIAKCVFYLGAGLISEINCGAKLTKISLNLGTNYNQYTTRISSVKDQVRRKHLHSELEKFYLRESNLVIRQLRVERSLYDLVFFAYHRVNFCKQLLNIILGNFIASALKITRGLLVTFMKLAAKGKGIPFPFKTLPLTEWSKLCNGLHWMTQKKTRGEEKEGGREINKLKTIESVDEERRDGGDLEKRKKQGDSRLCGLQDKSKQMDKVKINMRNKREMKRKKEKK